MYNELQMMGKEVAVVDLNLPRHLRRETEKNPVNCQLR
jgi:hypothetical protein